MTKCHWLALVVAASSIGCLESKTTDTSPGNDEGGTGDPTTSSEGSTSGTTATTDTSTSTTTSTTMQADTTSSESSSATEGSTGAGSDGGTAGDGSSSENGSSSGGMGDVCAAAADDDACWMCTKDMCCTELEACYADAGCACFVDCVADGGDVPTCFGQVCMLQNMPPGLAEVQSCQYMACDMPCPP